MCSSGAISSPVNLAPILRGRSKQSLDLCVIAPQLVQEPGDLDRINEYFLGLITKLESQQHVRTFSVLCGHHTCCPTFVPFRYLTQLCLFDALGMRALMVQGGSLRNTAMCVPR